MPIHAPTALALCLGASALACRTAPLHPIPEPLPEALAWEPADEGGAFLGLETRENDSGSLEELAFLPGVRVTAVADNSPAHAAGIRLGDVVLALDGREVSDPGALEALVARRAAGDAVELEVQRDDTVFGVSLELGGRSTGAEPPAVRYRADPSRTRAGWRTVDGGVQLVAAGPGGPVDAAGLPVGSVVTELEGRAVLSDRELIRRVQALEPGTRVVLGYVDPDGGRREARVRLLRQPRVVTGLSVPILVGYSRDVEADRVGFVLLDLWLISLFRYERDGGEKRWSVLRFLRFSTGAGELTR